MTRPAPQLSNGGARTAGGLGLMRCAIYARASTVDQEPENQLAELRHYTTARGWMAVEYVDRGISGSKDRRPALDQLVADVRRRKFDVLLCWRLARLGRNLRHLVVLLGELRAVGVREPNRSDSTRPRRRASCTARPRPRSPSSSGSACASASMRGGSSARAGDATRPTTQGAGGTGRPGRHGPRSRACLGVSKSTAARWI